MFTQNFTKIDRPLEEAHTSEGHFYVHKDTGEKYISITTIFKLLDKKEWYHFWVESEMRKQDIGEEEATKWCEDNGKMSMKVGTALHKIAEEYLSGNGYPPVYELKDFEKSPYELFIPLQKWFDENVKEVNATECKLYSDDLKLAGTVDMILTLNDGRKVIADIKNSRKPKTPGKIKDAHYYEQMVAYAKMWEFCTGEKLEEGIVLVISWDGKVRSFEVKLADYEESLTDWLLRYEQYKMLK